VTTRPSAATPPGRADDLLARLDAVQARLQERAASPPAPGLTEPDPPTGERWDQGQVWAHLAEFVPYWCDQVRLIVQHEGTDPVPAGRTKADPARIAAIEADRHRPPAELMARLAAQLEQLRSLIRSLSPEDWEKRGTHSTLGEMTMPAIFDEFLVGHLEDHAAQLEGLMHELPEA
jgi:DinB family protein